MSISEYLQKQDPPKEALEGLSGAGLGMAPPLTEHWLIANHLTSVIRPLLNNPFLEVGTESSQFYKNDSEDEKEDYYVLMLVSRSLEPILPKLIS